MAGQQLTRLGSLIEAYRGDEYLSPSKLTEMQRELVNIQFELTEINIEAFKDFNATVYNRIGSVSAAEVEAHQKHPELRETRKLLEVVKSALISIQNELKS